MKIALVDIDGCLINKEDHQLNFKLVERLKEYDQVILFTQRGKHLQQRNLASKMCNLEDTDSELRKQILTTKEAVESLESELSVSVKVSTSMDHYYNNWPTSYYDEVLKDFEGPLKEEFFTNTRNGKQLSLGIRESISTEHKMVAGNREYTLDNIDKLYPKGKVEQYRKLTNHLINSSSESLVIDYYDDSIENINEILNENDLPVTPRCVNIGGPSEKEDMLKIDLQDYINTRKQEQSFTNKEYKSKRSNFFKSGKSASASVKIAAAEKLLAKKLDPSDRSVFSRDEFKALTDGRLGDIVKSNNIRFEKQSSSAKPN